MFNPVKRKKRKDIVIKPNTDELALTDAGDIDWDAYDYVLVSFSGGKDSLASWLYMLDLGCPPEKIQLWHQLIDGEIPKGQCNFFDWPITEDYCNALAEEFGAFFRVERLLYYQFKIGGFEGEMLRENATTAGNCFEPQSGSNIQCGDPAPPPPRCGPTDREVLEKRNEKNAEIIAEEKRRKKLGMESLLWTKPTKKKPKKKKKMPKVVEIPGCGYWFDEAKYDKAGHRYTVKETVCPQCGLKRRNVGTRLKFPQKGKDMTTRWCTSYCKIDVMKSAITNSPEFDNARILVVTGERREESDNRAEYAEITQYLTPTQKGRSVTQWRAIIDWDEKSVWDIIKLWNIMPHPCYRLGFGRCSCITCIFCEPDQWASVLAIHPDLMHEIANYEHKFGSVIDRKGRDVLEVAETGIPYQQCLNDKRLVKLALGTKYPRDEIILDPWDYPAGAFKKDGGPS